MQNGEARPMSTPAILGIFTAAFGALVVLLVIVVTFLPFNNPAMGLIVVFAAGGVAANVWFSREKAAPASGRAWALAAMCGLIATLLSSGAAILGLSGDDRLWNELTGAGLTMVIVLAVIAVLQILIVRLSFWLSFRQAVKKAA
ncbi:ABZJ_00895 family protein [Rhizobium panacihumi]|uniref:ABZJ_00895 family protein n=1 Tax=Rhizobium panacihumi TaxID=2008450 RepID=UPI003D7925B8